MALSRAVRCVVSAVKQLPDGVQQLLIDRITLVRIVHNFRFYGWLRRPHLLGQQSRQPTRCVLIVALGCQTVASRFSLAGSISSPL
jgi:hypothetical protein